MIVISRNWRTFCKEIKFILYEDNAQ
jgi:hypothetical protein